MTIRYLKMNCGYIVDEMKLLLSKEELSKQNEVVSVLSSVMAQKDKQIKELMALIKTLRTGIEERERSGF
jgi:predicted transcriptional regulator